MTANSCVSGSTYKAIPPLSCLNMVNTLEITLDSETEVSDERFHRRQLFKASLFFFQTTEHTKGSERGGRGRTWKG